jgi:hypothetical protein
MNHNPTLTESEPPTKLQQNPQLDSELAEKFSNLAEQWETAVEGMSSTARMSQHPAYQEIIQMGDKIVPLLLKELNRNPLYWLSALQEITGRKSHPTRTTRSN